MSTLAVILAAGRGVRFLGAGHKLLAPFQGRPVIEHAVANAVAAAIGDVLVVWGAIDLRDAVAHDVQWVYNPRWAEGQASSLACALAVAEHTEAAAIVIGLGDQPLIPPETWRAVAAAPGELATAVIGGRRTPPVRIGRSLWPFVPTEGDEGARVLMRSRPDLVTEIACGGQALDIDTLEDLRPWI